MMKRLGATRGYVSTVLEMTEKTLDIMVPPERAAGRAQSTALGMTLSRSSCISQNHFRNELTIRMPLLAM